MTYNEKFPQGAFLPLGELPVADFIVPSEDFECDEYLCETRNNKFLENTKETVR